MTSTGEVDAVVQTLTVYTNMAVVGNLIPYVAYSFRVQYVNSIGAGPMMSFENEADGLVIRTREAGL